MMYSACAHSYQQVNVSDGDGTYGSVAISAQGAPFSQLPSGHLYSCPAAAGAISRALLSVFIETGP